ncbi:hypothetical protein ACHAWT_004057 [Skeletonema menzelii]
MGLLKKLGNKKGKKQSAVRTAVGEENHVNNSNTEEIEAAKLQAEPVPKETKKKTADEIVAEMFSKKKQDDTNQHKASTSPKQNADERVAQMFANSKASNDSKPNVVATKLDAEQLVAEMRLSSKSQSDRTKEEQKVPAVGKNTEQKKAIEAAFGGSKKGATKVDVPIESANSFAQRRKMAEEMSQRKVVTEELKHTVDVSAEDFGDKVSFAKRREMLEAKSQGQNMAMMGSPTNGAPSNQLKA